MDFGKYDDYSHDNNPFAGSNHFYSNGILNASEEHDDHAYSGGIFSDTNKADSRTSIQDLSRSKSGLLDGSGIFGADFASDMNSEEHSTPPHINNFNSGLREFHDSNKSEGDHNETEENLHDQVRFIGHHDEDDKDDEADKKHTDDTDEDYDFSQISISEQPTLYVNTDETVDAEDTANTAESDLSFLVTNDKMKVTGSTKNFMTVYYEIEYFGSIVHRRYSDFVSFRTYLLKFFQTKIIPPIPEKHSFSRVIGNPLSYKQDSEIIDRRIRLLEYFLDRLYRDPEIRKSLIFRKFLDPEEKRWSHTLNNPPFTTLASRSLLLTSPRDPIKPNPYIVYLPVPPIGHLKKFNSKLNSTVFEPMELRLKSILEHVKNLENIVKKLLHNLEKERISMVELGGFFNIFSILEEQKHWKLVEGYSYSYPEDSQSANNTNNTNNSGYIEKFGDKVDWSFLKIQELISRLTIRVKEPLIILKQTILAMIQLLAYRKLKELQMSCLQDIILRKQVRLKGIIEKLSNHIKLNEVLSNPHIDSPTVNNALRTVKAKRSKYGNLAESSVIIINDDTPPSSGETTAENSVDNSTINASVPNSHETNDSLGYSNTTSDSNLATSSDHLGNSTWKKAIAGSSAESASATNHYLLSDASPRRRRGHLRNASTGADLSKYSPAELTQELNKLNQELNTKLIPCFHSLLEDVKYLSINVEKNVNSHYVKVINSITFIMSEWKSKVFLEFFENCEQIWGQEGDEARV